MGRRIVTFALVLVVAVGGYLLIRNFDFPDLSTTSTTGTSPTDFAAGSESVPGGKTLLKTENFLKALGAFSGEVGDDPKITKVEITPNNVDFHFREGQNVDGYGFTAADEKLHPIQVRVVGSGSIEGLDFPLTKVQPEAVDKLVDGARKKSGLKNFKVTVMTLARSHPRSAEVDDRRRGRGAKRGRPDREAQRNPHQGPQVRAGAGAASGGQGPPAHGAPPRHPPGGPKARRVHPEGRRRHRADPGLPEAVLALGDL
jgi:hypothetical protein